MGEIVQHPQPTRRRARAKDNLQALISKAREENPAGGVLVLIGPDESVTVETSATTSAWEAMQLLEMGLHMLASEQGIGVTVAKTLMQVRGE